MGGDLSAVSTGELSADVVATQLVLTQPPADNRVADSADELVSGRAFASQPVVTAQNGQAITDTDFADPVSAVVSQGPGTLSGAPTVTAVAGVATFSDLAYSATADGEALRLQFDDVPAGSGGDLAAVTTQELTVDAVATQLILTQTPADNRVIDSSDEVVSSYPFALQPVVSARDAAGILDADFADVVTASRGAGSGVLSGTQSVTASAGIATFIDLAYLASADGEAFTLSFDDETAGSGGDLGSVVSAPLSADVIATQLVVTRLPTDGRTVDSSDEVVNGVVFATQPTVAAQDAMGRVDEDVTDVLTVGLASGSGNLLGTQSVAATSGIATFSNLGYSAPADGAVFVLRFDDEATGSGGDLGVVSTSELSADIVATQLVITQSPADGRVADPGDEVVSGLAFQTQAIVAAQDAAGRIDADFTDQISAVLTAGSGTLSGTQSVSAVAGVATFGDLSYAAQADGEPLALRFDDESSGSGGDLGGVNTQNLSADVVATRLTFQTQPDPQIVPINQNFAVNGITVAAVNTEGLLDSDYAGAISLLAVATGTTDSPAGGGSLTATPIATLTPSAGVATWTYLALDQGAAIDLLAVSGGLQEARSQPVSVIIPQNNAAPVVARTIAPQPLVIGKDVFARRLLGQNPIFTDADGDALVLTAAVADPAVATAVLSAEELVVTPQLRGLTTVTLTADDGKGGTVSSEIIVISTPPLSIPHLASAALPVIDGDLSDWETQFDQPHLVQEQFISIAGEALGLLALSDQRVDVWLGWNASTNLIYVAGRVTDNSLALPSDSGNPAVVGHGDDMEFFLDVDQSGGVYDAGHPHAQRYILNASGSPGPVVFPHAITNPPLAQAAVQRAGTTYSFEWALPGWDDLQADGTGTRHTLQPGAAVSVGVGFADFESQSAADAGNYHAYNALLGRNLLSGNADDFWSGQLAAPVVVVSTTTTSGADVNVRLEAVGEIPAATVTVVFDAVASNGTTVLTAGSAGPPPPPDFTVPDDPLYYELETSATYTGSIELCFEYGGTPLANRDRLALLHFVEFGWIDITTSVDYANKRVCGATSSFSTFTVLQKTLQAPTLVAFNGITSPTFTPTLDWDDIAGAASYVLEYAGSSDFANPATVGGLTVSQYTFPSPLGDGTVFWRVRAIGSAGEQGPLSSIDSFVIIPTLSEWAMIFLGCFMMGYVCWRRRSTAHAR